LDSIGFEAFYTVSVIPAKAGIHRVERKMDSSFRWNDEESKVGGINHA
jgi:hypothetical protein